MADGIMESRNPCEKLPFRGVNYCEQKRWKQTWVRSSQAQEL